MRAAGRWSIAVWLVVAALATGIGLGLRRRARTADLPRYGRVPEFVMTDQAGRRFAGGDLDGKVWVANFIFTRCSTACPMLSAKMAALDGATRRFDPARVHLVSFSVDPERDTPAELAVYAERFHADPARWSFLTGPRSAVEKAVVDGFKMGLSRERPGPGEPPGEGEDGFAILHGTRFVLVDAGGVIRGYYDAGDGMPALTAAVERLVEAGAR